MSGAGMGAFSGMKMPMEVIVRADMVIGGGKVLKNRHGQIGQADETLPPGVEVAIRDGVLIWDSRTAK